MYKRIFLILPFLLLLLLLFFFFFPPIKVSQEPSASKEFILGLISAVFINIIAGWISYFFQGKSKMRDASDTARDMLVYVNMALCLQRAELANIQKIFNEHKIFEQNKLSLQKLIVAPSVVSIKEEYLQKILTYPGFGKSKAYPATFQCIIAADSLYQKCLMYANEFNGAIDEDRFINANDKSQSITLQILTSAQEGVLLTCEEAIVVNKNARDRATAIAKEVFDIKNLMLPTIEEKTIRSTEL